MDTTYVAAKGSRSTVVSESALVKFAQRDGLIMGIVREAETSDSKNCSLINIETGQDKNIVLLIKNNAGFLAGCLVLYDQRGKSVSWIENDSYTFGVVARVKPRPVRPDTLAMYIECPECHDKIRTGDISGHLKRQHWFPRTIDLDRLPDQFASSSRKPRVESNAVVKSPTLQRICPNSSRWNEVSQQLLRYAQTHVCHPSRPPTPLILGGWALSNDVEKMQRWRETVDWVTANGCRNIVEQIPDEDFYKVEKPSSQPVGPMGGPCYRPWDFEAKVRPPEDELRKHFEYLSTYWADIAGPGLSAITRPVAFTGRKARRLLVQAEQAASPPWGGWSHRDQDEARRRTFTRFRSTVNKAINPHEVDHIDFIEARDEKLP